MAIMIVVVVEGSFFSIVKRVFPYTSVCLRGCVFHMARTEIVQYYNTRTLRLIKAKGFCCSLLCLQGTYPAASP